MKRQGWAAVESGARWGNNESMILRLLADQGVWHDRLREVSEFCQVACGTDVCLSVSTDDTIID